MSNPRINDVDFNEMASKAKNIREDAKNVNTQLEKLYKAIEDMYAVWYGLSYTNLVRAFNDIISQINKLLDVIVTDIPTYLERQANSYAQPNIGANITSVTEEMPDHIVPVPDHDDMKNQYRFLADEVDTIKTNVITYLTDAKSYMDKIERTYRSIPWDTMGAKVEFEDVFNKLKPNIVKSLDNVQSAFEKEITINTANAAASDNSK